MLCLFIDSNTEEDTRKKMKYFWYAFLYAFFILRKAKLQVKLIKLVCSFYEKVL